MALQFNIERIEVDSVPQDQFTKLVLDSYEKTGDQYPWPESHNTPEEAAAWYYTYMHETASNEVFAPAVTSRLFIWRIPETVSSEQPYGFILAAFRVIIDGPRLLLTDGVIGKDPNDSRAWVYDPDFKQADMKWRRDNGITEVSFVTYHELTKLDNFINSHWSQNEGLTGETEEDSGLVYKKTYGVVGQ
jgi:hypothetical protein